MPQKNVLCPVHFVPSCCSLQCLVNYARTCSNLLILVLVKQVGTYVFPSAVRLFNKRHLFLSILPRYFLTSRDKVRVEPRSSFKIVFLCISNCPYLLIIVLKPKDGSGLPGHVLLLNSGDNLLRLVYLFFFPSRCSDKCQITNEQKECLMWGNEAVTYQDLPYIFSYRRRRRETLLVEPAMPRSAFLRLLRNVCGEFSI